MSKRNSIVLKIVFLSILAFALIGFMFFCFYFTFNHNKFKGDWFDFKEESYKLVKSETYSVEEIKSIYLDFTSADIDVRYSDNDTVKIDLYDKDESDFNVSVNNGILEVKHNRSFDFCIGFCFTSRRAILYLPQSFSGEIKIETDSGDVRIPDLRSSDMIINTVSGDVSVSGAKNISVKTTSGEVDINNVTDLKVSTKSGDIEIMDVSNVSGDTISGSLEIFRLRDSIDFKTTSGDIDLSDVILNRNSKLSTVSGDVEIERINLVNVITSTVSGDTEVYTMDRTSKIELNIKTTSGDIEVK